MRDGTQLATLSRAMKARGFEYDGRQGDNWLRFRGTVTAAGANHSAVVEVDPVGQQLPRVYVDLPKDAPDVLPHLGAGGFVCYAAKGSLVLDIFDVAGQTLACIDRAGEVLDLSLRGMMHQDLEEEFFAFWHGDLCFLDVDGGDSGKLDVLFARRGSSGEPEYTFVTNDVTRTRQKLRAMALQEAELLPGAAFRVKTCAKPRPLQAQWPPATVAALLQWQGLLDRSARRNIERRLLEAVSGGRRASLCVMDSPLTQYAFWVQLKQELPGGRDPARDRRVRLYASEVNPMIAVRIDDSYVAQRNSPGRATLADKKIALIGCGTIGGFLAELLVKAGAGLGSGEAALIDPDTLLPQNIGRHRLGLNRVLQNKAVALAEELSLGAPTARIRALRAKAEEVELGRFDLIINATGEEALGHHLTRSLKDRETTIPVLSVWVEGPGVAVRALLRDADDQACTRCLSDLKRRPLYPAVTEAMPTELAGHGCESLYVPFPATASVQAACLAVDMAAAWANKQASPRLQTRVIHPGFTQATVNSDVPRLHACPACSS